MGFKRSIRCPACYKGRRAYLFDEPEDNEGFRYPRYYCEHGRHIISITKDHEAGMF